MATVTWHGFKLRVRAYQLKGETLRKIGINPEHFREGVEIFLASPAYFRCINELFGRKPGSLAGIYLPPARKILVSEDISRLELCHEVLHALFAAKSPAEQEAFSRLVREIAERDPDDKFFQGVCRRSNGDRVFITEVFAFAGTKVIFERMGVGMVEKDLAEVPPELKAYFERKVVDPQLLAAPLQKIA